MQNKIFLMVAMLMISPAIFAETLNPVDSMPPLVSTSPEEKAEAKAKENAKRTLNHFDRKPIKTSTKTVKKLKPKHRIPQDGDRGDSEVSGTPIVVE